MTLLDGVGYLFAAYVTVSCVRHLAKGGLKNDYAVFKGRTWRTWALILAGDIAAIGILILAAVGSTYAPPWLSYSWLMLLAPKNQPVQATNQMLAGAQIPLFGVVFVIILMLNLPRLAALEEDEFREGTKDWKDAIPRSLKFGLMHMIVGVPLWCGLALAIPGMWFTSQYFKGGVSRSTMAHALYNFMLASLLSVYVFWTNYQTIAAAFHKHR
jgi:hypothetical protein